MRVTPTPSQQLDNRRESPCLPSGPLYPSGLGGGELRANQASEAARGTDQALGQIGKCVDKGYQAPGFASACLTHRRMEDLLHLEVGGRSCRSQSYANRIRATHTSLGTLGFLFKSSWPLSQPLSC